MTMMHPAHFNKKKLNVVQLNELHYILNAYRTYCMLTWTNNKRKTNA